MEAGSIHKSMCMVEIHSQRRLKCTCPKGNSTSASSTRSPASAHSVLDEAEQYTSVPQFLSVALLEWKISFGDTENVVQA